MRSFGLLAATVLVLGQTGSDSVASANGIAFIDHFETRVERAWQLSNYAHPGEWLDTRWRPEQVAETEPGQIEVRLVPSPVPGKGFLSGELRWPETTHYGRYEVVMQAARGVGVTSNFFTYTGKHRGDPHDEINFEILGKDTTQISVNLYANGITMPGLMVPLGFDAAEAPHLYTFEWLPDRIRWYADGNLLFEFAPDDVTRLPQTPGQVYLNLWAGHPKIGAWLGNPEAETRTEAKYFCVSFQPMGEDAPQCSDPTG